MNYPRDLIGKCLRQFDGFLRRDLCVRVMPQPITPWLK
jgi:hypothetical protein